LARGEPHKIVDGRGRKSQGKTARSKTGKERGDARVGEKEGKTGRQNEKTSFTANPRKGGWGGGGGRILRGDFANTFRKKRKKEGRN